MQLLFAVKPGAIQQELCQQPTGRPVAPFALPERQAVPAIPDAPSCTYG